MLLDNENNIGNHMTPPPKKKYRKYGEEKKWYGASVDCA